VGAQRLLWLEEPYMPAEDFSFYGRVAKAGFIILGTGDERLGTSVGLHRPGFTMNEEVMPIGAALHAALALEFLAREARGGAAAGCPGLEAGGAGGSCAAE
jgi:metal-dependent amidase/aminoacylase/carboxypeptidase family protein